MAYIRKQRGKWRAEIEKAGVRKSATFLTKAEATNWAAAEEAAILAGTRGQYPRKTLGDALDEYERRVSVHKKGARHEGLRMQALRRDFPELSGKILSEITTPDLVAWRDARLQTVTPGSVQRDINLLRNVFAVARDEWHWCGQNPFTGMRMPGDNPARQRRVKPAEAKAICRWLGYRTGVVETKQQEVALAFLLSLRSGMRVGEILALTDQNVDLDKRVARVPHKTQHITGKPRAVPLTKHAVRLLRVLAGRKGPLFTVTAASLDALFRKARTNVGIDDLHFHDARAEALTRLSRKVDPLTLARISGHKDLKILMEVYYREEAEAIAARL